MHRSPFLLPTTAILAVLTALVLLGAGVAIRPPKVPAPAANPAEAAHRAVVRRFYEAVNTVIASGDSADLAAIVTPDYTESDIAGAALSGLTSLERYLLSLRESAPGLRLVADSIAVEDDRVIALVRAVGGETAFLGLALDGRSLWGPVDVFRIADGRIAERASTDEPHVFLQPDVRTAVDVRSTTTKVTVQRAILPPGGWRRGSSVDGLRWLYVESGALAINIAAERDRPAVIPAIDEEAFATGQPLVRLDGAGYGVRNVGAEPAVLLEILAVVVTPGGTTGLVASSTGIPAQVLAGGQAVTTAPGTTAIAVGRLSLAPGAAIGWAGGPGPVLLAVERGEVGLATVDETVCVRRAVNGSVGLQEETKLTPGDGALASAWSGVSLRNSGDSSGELLVVTLLHGPSPSTPAPTAIVPVPTAASTPSIPDPTTADFPAMRRGPSSDQEVGTCW